MKAHNWSTVSVGNYTLTAPDKGPHRYIPVFNSREQAVEWAGSDEHVRKLEAMP